MAYKKATSKSKQPARGAMKSTKGKSVMRSAMSNGTGSNSMKSKSKMKKK